MKLPVIAAWLRDIGIFACRAGTDFSGKTASQTEKTSQCDLYTTQFVENILPLPPELESERQLLANMAACGGATREGPAIRKAAWLAAGMLEASPESGAPLLLNSVFAKVRLGEKCLPGDAPQLQYQLRQLCDDDALFPSVSTASKPDYAKHWQDFATAVARLPCDMGVNVWLASLVSLLERYCWCIPYNAAQALQEISLFDHAATMTAIAQALLACPAGQERFLLFGGDLSGIQAFIFGREEPADKGAARLLRARSFLLQAVTRSLWLVLIKRLHLDPAAKIMDAGGRFALLLPDMQAALDQIQALELEAGSWLLAKFQGAVRLNLACVSLAEQDFGADAFRLKFEDFNDALETAKLKPFHLAFAQNLLPVLPVRYADYNKFGECAFCHTQPGSGLDEEKPICDQCRLLRKLGAKLPSTRFIAFTTIQENGPEDFGKLLFDGLSLRFYRELPTARDAACALQILSIKEEPIFTITPIAGHIPVISREDIRRWQAESRFSEPEDLFMGERCHPGEPKTFTMLAQEARIPPVAPGGHWTCMPCLGICKADVDNLGLVFSLGFGNSFSLSRYAMLARMLNSFFSGYLIRLIRKLFPNVYVVFAGGDDVFVIGPWTETIVFALRMAGDFRKFCGGNPAMTLSAGVPLIKPGLPMRAMRDSAEECLEKSKNYKRGAKNAVTIFDISAHWVQAGEFLETGAWLAEMCESGSISRGFLRRLLGYSRQCRDFIQGRNLAENGLYLSHFQYDLARNWDKMGGNRQKDASNAGENEENLLRLKQMACDDERFAKSEMGIAWAIYRERIS